MEGSGRPAHDATLPFTTLLSGPSDFTPGLFSPADDPATTTIDENGRRNDTTWSHQMAMGVLITSPIIHWGSGPQTLTNALPNGSPQLDVFKAIPSTWDETDVLDISQIGTLAAFARRDGNTWFLAMVNGDPTNPMTVNNIDLSFLGSSQYDATLLFDDLSIDEQFDSTLVHSLTSTYDLDVTMRRGGGFVAMFTLVPEPGTFGLLAVAMAAMLWQYRRRMRFGTAGS
jgi:alpha-glucosidase